jgi:hypothetical protein
MKHPEKILGLHYRIGAGAKQRRELRIALQAKRKGYSWRKGGYHPQTHNRARVAIRMLALLLPSPTLCMCSASWSGGHPKHVMWNLPGGVSQELRNVGGAKEVTWGVVAW